MKSYTLAYRKYSKLLWSQTFYWRKTSLNTILIIDDDKDYRASLVEILELETYRALEAENGQIGLQIIYEHSPNLIVCDIDMPVMNGIEVLRVAKADPIVAKIPFLIVTGINDELTLKKSRDLEAEAFLTKPVDIFKFLSTVDGLLNAESPASRSA